MLREAGKKDEGLTLRVVAKHFCVGIDVNRNGIITHGPPIMKGWLGKTVGVMLRYYAKKGQLIYWQVL